MNREHVLRVADAIEHETVSGLGFDMSSFFYVSSCGTTACIAGWCAALDGTVTAETPSAVADGIDMYEIGREYLGLTIDQANRLFYVDAPRREAVATLRRLAGTDVVDWDRFNEVK